MRLSLIMHDVCTFWWKVRKCNSHELPYCLLNPYKQNLSQFGENTHQMLYGTPLIAIFCSAHCILKRLASMLSADFTSYVFATFTFYMCPNSIMVFGVYFTKIKILWTQWCNSKLFEPNHVYNPILISANAQKGTGKGPFQNHLVWKHKRRYSRHLYTEVVTLAELVLW